jgi:hypothetical protein
MDPIVLFLYAIVGGLVGAAIGARKNRAAAGFGFGLLLGPIGWLLVALGPDLREKGPACPYCGGEMVAGKAVCRHCGREIAAPEPAPEPETVAPRAPGVALISGRVRGAVSRFLKMPSVAGACWKKVAPGQ